MKAKMLLCMMLLGLLTATAQPRVTSNDYRQLPNPHGAIVKTFLNEANAMNTPQRATKAKAGAVTHIVELALQFDTETEEATQIRLINDEYNLATPEDWEFNNGSNYLEVPEGTFDIIVTFVTLNTICDDGQPFNTKHVIREQVAINQDIRLDVAVTEAKNRIHIQTLTPNGEIAYASKWALDEDYNFVLLEDSNCEDLYYHNCIYCEDYGLIDLQYANYSYSLVDASGTYWMICHEDNADFYVNDVSDRYTFYAYRVGYKDCNFFTSAYEVQGATSDITLTNDPTKYELFEDPFISKLAQDEEVFWQFGFGAPLKDTTKPIFQLFQMTIPLADGVPCKYYIGASPDDSKVGFMPIIEPGVCVSAPGSSFKRSYRVAPRLLNTDGLLFFANNGIGSTIGYDKWWGFVTFGGGFDGQDPILFPVKSSYNPAFSYPVDQKMGTLGNNCPILICSACQATEITPYGNFYILSFHGDYMGRYGEKNYKSHYETLCKVELNGEEIYSGKERYLYFDEPIQGEVDGYITNETVTVDDMVGSNKAHMHFTAGAEDQGTPTLTMLQFKDDNGIVTDRFTNAADGILEFTAGDFNIVSLIDDVTYYDRQAPESVEVSYSPYCEDNWDELAVEEVPENYWPVMGWFYTGSLAGVTGQGLNGWFDLKIRLTDAAGNWQEQVISPAFRLDDHAFSSVATLHDNNAHEVARYNLAGQRVNSDATGVVIIKMSDGTARKVMVK